MGGQLYFVERLFCSPAPVAAFGAEARIHLEVLKEDTADVLHLPIVVAIPAILIAGAYRYHNEVAGVLLTF